MVREEVGVPGRREGLRLGVDAEKLGTRIVEQMRTTATQVTEAATSASQQTLTENAALQGIPKNGSQ